MAADLQPLLGGGLVRIAKLIQAWHRWRKGGYGFDRVWFFNFTVLFQEPQSFPCTLWSVEA